MENQGNSAGFSRISWPLFCDFCKTIPHCIDLSWKSLTLKQIMIVEWILLQYGLTRCASGFSLLVYTLFWVIESKISRQRHLLVNFLAEIKKKWERDSRKSWRISSIFHRLVLEKQYIFDRSKVYQILEFSPPKNALITSEFGAWVLISPISN